MGRKVAEAMPVAERKELFLAALRKAPNITAAAKAAGWTRDYAYRLRKIDDTFAEAWANALEEALDVCEQELHRRAFTGTLKPVYQGGEQVGTIREYSDTLAIFLMKAHRPQKFRDNVRLEHTGRLDIRNVTELSDDELAHIAAGGSAGAAAEASGAPESA